MHLDLARPAPAISQPSTMSSVIPTVDVAAFREAADPHSDAGAVAAARAMGEAFERCGFVVITGHGLPVELARRRLMSFSREPPSALLSLLHGASRAWLSEITRIHGPRWSSAMRFTRRARRSTTSTGRPSCAATTSSRGAPSRTTSIISPVPLRSRRPTPAAARAVRRHGDENVSQLIGNMSKPNDISDRLSIANERNKKASASIQNALKHLPLHPLEAHRLPPPPFVGVFARPVPPHETLPPRHPLTPGSAPAPPTADERDGAAEQPGGTAPARHPLRQPARGRAAGGATDLRPGEWRPLSPLTPRLSRSPDYGTSRYFRGRSCCIGTES
eukprot:SAG11_NODE_615_length_8197_cov_4.551426_7_plen_332_part_00